MAKQKISMGTNSFSFADLTKGLKQFSHDSVLLSVDSDSISINEFIDTGNYLLNAQISGDIYGGIPAGKVTMVSGPSGTGKTYFCLNAARSAQIMGYNIFWIDTERALDTDSLDRFGIKKDTFSYNPLSEINSVTSLLTNMCKMLIETKKKEGEVPKILVVLDSLGNLHSTKESEDSIKSAQKQDMTRPKELKKLFRIVMNDLGKLKIPMIITNHVYSKQDMFGGYEISGGTGSIFNASTIIMLTKAKLKDSNQATTGIVVTSKIHKSRFTKAGIDVKFHISFYTGMNPYVGLYEYCDWETCGIEIGKYDPKKDEFTASSTGRTVAVKHLGGNVATNKLFTPEVFTPEVLEMLRPVVKSVFELPPVNSDNIDYGVDINEVEGETPDE